MIYILFRVLLQNVFQHAIRFGQARGIPVIGLALINYGFAAFFCLGLAFLDGGPGFSRPTLLYGGIAGVAYLVCLLMIPPAMLGSGVAITGAVLQLAVLLPVAHAMAVFGERPSAAQAAGLLLAIGALVVLSATSSAPDGAVRGARCAVRTAVRGARCAVRGEDGGSSHAERQTDASTAHPALRTAHASESEHRTRA